MKHIEVDECSAMPFVDGAPVASESVGVTEVTNPSNGETVHLLPRGSDADVDRAVTSARRSFEDGRWVGEAPSHRKRVLHTWADLIDANASVLDQMDAEEMGKPLSQRRASAATAASLVRFCAEAVDKVEGTVFSSDRKSLVLQRQVPCGVVAAVVPWNFPTYNAVLKAAPALAAGNCVVLKPSELSSRSAVCLAKLALGAGLPSGILNVVPGLGTTVGRSLALHRDVDLLTFTGSTATGKLLLQYAGQSNMKRVIAECGGKAPHIVFDDGIDLDFMSAWIAQMLLANQGQICSVGSRLLVERTIERPLVQRIVRHLQNFVMGDARDPATTFGPLASRPQLERVMHFINVTRGDGAELVTGGARALEQSGGYFVLPTLFRCVRPKAPIAQEEVFGPVLSVTAFSDEEEAVRIANDTRYGLIAYLWTTQLSRAMRVAKSVDSSIVVNALARSGEGAGFAGSYEPAKESGLGVEGGIAGLEGYFRRQTIWINHA